MSQFSQKTIEDAIAIMRSLDEKSLRDTIIEPLLVALERNFIRNNHGPSERGKDYIYLARDALSGEILTVCQVKNEVITGSSTSSNGVSGILNQIELAKRTRVLNPSTNLKELPQRIEFITTYPLPDAGTGDLDQHLQQLRQAATIIPPERLAQLVLTHVPQKLYSFSPKDSSVFGAIKRYVEVNHEAIAFNSRMDELIPSIFVEPFCSIQYQGDAADSSKSQWENVAAPQAVVRAANFFWRRFANKDLLAPATTQVNGQTTKTPKRLSKSIAIQKELRNFHLPSMPSIRSDISGILRRLERELAEGNSTITFCDFLEWFRVLRELLEFDVDQDFAKCFEACLNEEIEKSTIQPSVQDILESSCDVAIIGPAGYGKSFLLRMLAYRSFESKDKCLFLPCKLVTAARNGLERAIEEFVEDVSGTSYEEFTSVCPRLDLVILDGCDEAKSFPKVMGEQISRLVMPEPTEIDGDMDLIIPRSLHDKFEFRRSKIKINDRFSKAEIELLRICNEPSGESTVESMGLLKAFGQLYRNVPARIILASREIIEMTELPSLQVLRMNPFDDDQQLNYFKKRFRNNPSSEKTVSQFLRKNASIKEAARSPMMASIIAGLHEGGVPLPISKVDIYEKRFDLLLGEWDSVRGVERQKLISAEEKKRLLQSIAYSMHSKHQQSISASEIQRIWKSGFERGYPQVLFADVLGELTDKDSVLYKISRDQYTLGHLSYQEFLVARYLALAGMASFLGKKLDDKWWQNVARFFAGIASDLKTLLAEAQARGTFDSQKALIRELVNESRNAPKEFVELISELL